MIDTHMCVSYMMVQPWIQTYVMWTIENPKLGIVRFIICDFKFFNFQVLFTTRWHFISSMIHVLPSFLAIHHTIVIPDQSCSILHYHTNWRCGMHYRHACCRTICCSCIEVYKHQAYQNVEILNYKMHKLS